MSFSDEMWGNGIKILKYMLKRGAHFDNDMTSFNLEYVQPNDFDGEVQAMALTLDMFKEQARDVVLTIKQAMNKHTDEAGTPTYFDPSVSISTIQTKKII